MINQTKHIMRGLRLIILLFPFAQVGATEIAVLSGDGGKVYFDIDPAIDYGTADLRVSSPAGDVSIQLFNRDEVPVYPLADSIPSDGSYNYELTLNPVVSMKTALKSSKSGAIDENGRPMGAQKVSKVALPQAQVQSGGFAIENGAMIPPGAEE